MGTRQGEADVMDRVHEVCWDTEQNEIEALMLIVGTRIEQRNYPPIGYRTWTEVLIDIVRKRNTRSPDQMKAIWPSGRSESVISMPGEWSGPVENDGLGQ